MTDSAGAVVDFTNLDKAFNHLMDPRICLTKLINKPRNQRAFDYTNLDGFSLTSCLDYGDANYAQLVRDYPFNRPDQMAQLILYRMLEPVLLPCYSLSTKKQSEKSMVKGRRILAYAINYAFISCIQKDEQGSYCKNERGLLYGYLDGNAESGGNRKKLYECLRQLWFDRLGTFNEAGCAGNPREVVQMGVREAVRGATVGVPARETHNAFWYSASDHWNVPLSLAPCASTKRALQCPNANLRPEFLCTPGHPQAYCSLPPQRGGADAVRGRLSLACAFLLTGVFGVQVFVF